jgi:hypothetical protein
MYTMDIEALSNLVEESRLKYIEGRRPHVIVHGIDLASLSMSFYASLRALISHTDHWQHLEHGKTQKQATTGIHHST